MKTYLTAGIALALALTATAQTASHEADKHHSEVAQRGDQAMGFSHDKTTHHFRLLKDGGAIEVLADDPGDTVNRDAIRMHLSHIAKMFADGDFDIPMFIHATNPPGAAEMARLRQQIHYQYRDTDAGGQVQIQTTNPKAVAAIHEFLRFQISDHQTGDPTTVVSGDLPKSKP